MRQLSPEHRVLELHREALAAADSIFRRQGAAEHRVTRFQGIATHQILGRADGGDRALLVELAVGPGAQHQALPVRLDLVVAPRFTRHGLGAELLGERYADGFRFAVRVVRTQGHAQFTSLKKNELNFPARVRPGDLYLVRESQKMRRNPVEDRRGLRRLDAQRLELPDVLAQRLLVAAGPAGDDKFSDFHYAALRTLLISGIS